MSNDTSQPEKKKAPSTSKLWVPIVILIGIIAGLVTYLLISPYLVFFPPPRPGQFALLQSLETAIAVQIILTTTSIALLVALVIVYYRTYAHTGANFILGLLVVLLALLLQSVLTYPLVYPLVDNAPWQSTGLSLPIADIFTVVAYSVFLYLSLE